MSLALVEGADAFLEGKQTLIDLCSIDAGLLVHIHVIGSSFVAGEVDEADLPEGLFAFFEGDLEDGVRAGGVCVGGVLGGDPFLGALREVVDELFGRTHGGFLQPDYIYVVLVVFTQLQLGALVQQVVQLSAVDLVEGEPRLQMPVLGLANTFPTLDR